MNDQTKPTRLSLSGAKRRMRDFCLVTQTTAPASIVDRHGAPTDELLAFCRETGLSLDWLFLGDPLPMMLGIHTDRQKAKLTTMSLTVLFALLNREERDEVFAHIRKLADDRGITAEPPSEEGPTIAALFEEWRDLEREALDNATDEDRMNELLARCYQIEELAATLPAKTALDVWRLIRMTTDEKNETPRTTSDTIVARAYIEAEA